MKTALAVNSSLFRKGGDFMRTSKYKGEIYMTIDKKGVRWIGLRNDVTKLEDNAAKYKKLLAKGENKMGYEKLNCVR